MEKQKEKKNSEKDIWHWEIYEADLRYLRRLRHVDKDNGNGIDNGVRVLI